MIASIFTPITPEPEPCSLDNGGSQPDGSSGSLTQHCQRRLTFPGVMLDRGRVFQWLDRLISKSANLNTSFPSLSDRLQELRLQPVRYESARRQPQR